jgi:hypothetical protein
MTTQDSTYETASGTDQYDVGQAPEDAERRDEHDGGQERSYADQHSEHSTNGSGRSAESAAGADGGSGGQRSGDAAATLIPAERAGQFRGRWTELKGDFVDDPRHTVRKIDGLVGEVLDELNEIFKRQRGELETDLKNDEASTEDLRVAFGRYREFFDRLLSF